MRHAIAVLAIGIGLASLAAMGGFWVGKESDARQRQALTQELQRQRVTLDRIRDDLALLARPRTEASVRSESTGAGNLQALQATMNEAFERFFERQSQQLASAEQATNPPPSDESLEAHAKGESLVTAAFKAKRWTQSDAVALRQLTGQLTSEQAAQLLARLSVGINQGQLTVQTDGPPF